MLLAAMLDIMNNATNLPECVTEIIFEMAVPPFVIIDGEKYTAFVIIDGEEYTESSPNLVEKLKKGKSIQFFGGFRIPEKTRFNTQHEICVSGWGRLPKNCADMFAYCTFSTKSDLSDFEAGHANNMSGMFRFSTFNGDVSMWDTSSVTDMGLMFLECKSFNGDVSMWDTSSVTDMGAMFCSAGSFNGDVSMWDTSSVTDMSYMFNGAHAFNGDVSMWHVFNVENMTEMFDCADSMEERHKPHFA
jgi:surface protein